MSILDKLPNTIKNVDETKLNLPSWCDKIKIDVGTSHNAPISQQWLSENDNVIVFAFEPNSQSIKTIKGEIDPPKPYDKKKRFNIQLINERFFLINAALGEYNGVSTFYEVKNKLDENFFGYDLGSSSLNVPTFFEYDTETIDVYRLDEFLKYIDYEKLPIIEHVKIDAQGEDFKVIEGIGNYLDKIKYLTFEVTTYNQYQTQKNNSDELNHIVQYLTNNGFDTVSKHSGDMTLINRKFS